jgi:hypothetical protein
MVDDELEIEVADAAAGSTGAAVVGLQLALPAPERHVGLVQRLQHGLGLAHRPVGAQGEDRVTLHLLDLQGRGDLLHDLPQQLGDHGRAVLQLGLGDEGRESRDIRQDQRAVVRVPVHALEDPGPAGS